jgi:HEAT repeat protein
MKRPVLILLMVAAAVIVTFLLARDIRRRGPDPLGPGGSLATVRPPSMTAETIPQGRPAQSVQEEALGVKTPDETPPLIFSKPPVAQDGIGDPWSFSPEGRVRVQVLIGAVAYAIRHKDYERMQALIDAIKEMGAQAVGPLLDILIQDDDPRKSIYAALILGEMNAETPDPALTEALRDYALPYLERIAAGSEDASLRHSALVALGKIGDERSFDLLVEALSLEESPPLVDQATQSLTGLGGMATTSLLSRLAREEPDSALRLRLVAALAGREDPAALDALAELARRDFNQAVRLEAASGLAALSSEEAREVLRDIIESPDNPDIRAAALAGLGVAGNEDDLNLLENLLEGSGSNNVRTAAYKALSRIGTERAADATAAFKPAARVEAVVSGGNAASSGLLPDDLIIAYDGEAVSGAQALRDLVRESRPNRIIPITILRGGRTLPARVTGGSLGITLADGVARN